VLFLSRLTGQTALCCALGLALCLAAHAYHGRANLPFHARFDLCRIALLFSPLGLAACFGMHLAGDIYPLFALEKQLAAWKAYRRSKRQ